MKQISDLIRVIDTFKSAADIAADTTVSYRIFGDSKKLAALRDGAEISVGRFNAAVTWLSENWPETTAQPLLLQWLMERPKATSARRAEPSDMKEAS